MYKLFVLSCFIAAAFAKPGYLEPSVKTISVHSEVPVVKTKLIHEPATIAVQEHTIEKVGEHVESIPTAVSHQSQTIVHSKADKITPILAPAVQTRYEPTIRTYEKQYIEKVPVVESYVAPTVVKSYAAPAIVKSYDAPAFVKSYDAPAFVKSYDAPAFVNSYEAPAFVKSYDAPAFVKSYDAPALLRSYAAPSVYSSYAPLAYSSSLHHAHAPVVSSW